MAGPVALMTSDTRSYPGTKRFEDRELTAKNVISAAADQFDEISCGVERRARV